MDGRNTTAIANDAKLLSLPVAADAIINEGHLIVLNSTGFAEMATKAENLIAIGRAETFADNTGKVDGNISIEVLRGTFLWDNDTANAITQMHVGKKCYIVDSYTVGSLETGTSVAGKVLGFEDDQVIVETL